ncbi:glycerophosphodiester phosphodiesterase [Maribellus comscasis]|uniref:Glycerophosphodiester phosphodiesterase n=1 Tax=Maribellus comscasis TaxID=2681766 RepID=A0A6I6JNT3_9BACT|nr:glycerophosphodiester phosphodiesterase family protein [Maribellus comscasis]QGY42779.1 glycerophosphodiester phosphodiesterase [Maribellus comscasis]
MKKTILFVLAFCFSLSIVEGNIGLAFNGKTEKRKDLPVHGFCAHRGAMVTHPENTIVAFKAAVEAGAQMVELDVWLTQDGKMVIMHDETVDRTTNGSGRISDFTLAKIKKLDAGSWKSSDFEGEKVPTFEEALSVLPRNIWINVHVKGEGETPVMAAKLLQKENRLNQAFLACSGKAAKDAKEAVPGILICNMDRQDSNWDYVNATIKMKANFIQLKGKITPEFAEYTKALKKNGIRVNYFGTDSPDELKLLFEYGVDFPLVNDIVHTSGYLETILEGL